MMEKRPKIKFLMMLTLFIFSNAFLQCSLQNDPEKVDREVPPAVSDAFATAYPQAVIEEYTEEVEDGQMSYEIAFSENGTDFEVKYSESGELLGMEHSMAVADLPAAVRQAVAEFYARFSIVKAERIVEGGDTIYEVEVLNTDDNVLYEHQFAPDGTVLATEVEDND